MEVDNVQYYLLSEVDRAAGHLVDLARKQDTTSVSLCSVVPAVRTDLLNRLHDEAIETFEITYENQKMLTGLYPGIGADRVANMAAAYSIYAKRHALIVLDFGTATTMSVVSPTGQFLGGLITLGLGKTFAALHHATAQLPDMQQAFGDSEPNVFGRSTQDAIVSGCLLGHIGAVEKWIALAKKEIVGDAIVIATGGYSQAVTGQISSIDHRDPYLIFKGIGLIIDSHPNPHSKR
jgi:type III pantothenate kinase